MKFPRDSPANCYIKIIDDAKRLVLILRTKGDMLQIRILHKESEGESFKADMTLELEVRKSFIFPKIKTSNLLQIPGSQEANEALAALRQLISDSFQELKTTYKNLQNNFILIEREILENYFLKTSLELLISETGDKEKIKSNIKFLTREKEKLERDMLYNSEQIYSFIKEFVDANLEIPQEYIDELARAKTIEIDLKNIRREIKESRKQLKQCRENIKLYQETIQQSVADVVFAKINYHPLPKSSRQDEFIFSTNVDPRRETCNLDANAMLVYMNEHPLSDTDRNKSARKIKNCLLVGLSFETRDMLQSVGAPNNFFKKNFLDKAEDVAQWIKNLKGFMQQANLKYTPESEKSHSAVPTHQPGIK